MVFQTGLSSQGVRWDCTSPLGCTFDPSRSRIEGEEQQDIATREAAAAREEPRTFYLALPGQLGSGLAVAALESFEPS